MKNLYLALGAMALVGISNAALAQSTESVAVGTQDSANALIIQQDYQAVLPAPTPNENDASTTDWSQEGNVDVAPMPTPGVAAPASSNSSSSVTINEEIIDNNGLTDSEMQIDESIAN